MKEKILYLMHVDWHWIKQRPHFLAEALSASFELLVAHPLSNKRTHLVRNRTALRRAPLWALPFPRLKAITFINSILMNAYFFGLMLFYRPSIVWFTFPTLLPVMGLSLLKNKIIVYDCMDDAPEFMTDANVKRSILHKEKKMLASADIILVSSGNLFNKLKERGADVNKMTLVRNAFGGALHEDAGALPISDKQNVMFRILYIGSVSDYLDFDVILYCIEKLDTVEFNFIGPITTNVPRHDRLKYHGAVEHSSLQSRVPQFDIFIMPFIPNELIQGVDPVKLYEYINFGKNIVCPYYAEIDRFSDFVHFYRNRDEFVAVIKKLIEGNKRKYDSEQRRIFLDSNSWKERATEVIKLINIYLQSKRSASH